jgi:hypothetical protein
MSTPGAEPDVLLELAKPSRAARRRLKTAEESSDRLDFRDAVAQFHIVPNLAAAYRTATLA